MNVRNQPLFASIITSCAVFHAYAEPEIEIAFLLDGSVSIATSDFDLQKNSFINSLTEQLPTDGTVAVGIWQFSSTVQQEFSTTTINSLDDKNSMISALQGIEQLFGGTLVGSAITTASDEILGNNINSTTQIINVSTDGSGFDDPAIAASNAIAAGIEQVNCIGVGLSADCSFTTGIGAMATTADSFQEFETALNQQLEVLTGVPSSSTLVSAASSRNQTDVAMSIEQTCNANNLEQTRNADLQSLCSELQGLDNSGKSDAFEELSPREIGQQMNTVTQLGAIQTRNLNNHLNNVRAGRRGISAEGLEATIDGKKLDLGELIDKQWGLGGSAGDDFEDSRIGVFATGSMIDGDSKEQNGIEGFDFDTQSLTVGADYRINDRLFVGGAIGVSDLESKTDNSGSEFKADSISLSTYGSWYAKTNIYVDWVITYGSNDYDSQRVIMVGGMQEKALGSTDGSQWSVSGGTGYEYNLGANTLTGFFELGYMESSLDGYSETGSSLALAIDDQKVKSAPMSIGGRFDRIISLSRGVMIPQIELKWSNDLESDTRNISAFFVQSPSSGKFTVNTEKEDSNYFDLSLSLSATTGKHSGFIRYGTELFRDDISVNTIDIGYRLEF